MNENNNEIKVENDNPKSNKKNENNNEINVVQFDPKSTKRKLNTKMNQQNPLNQKDDRVIFNQKQKIMEKFWIRFLIFGVIIIVAIIIAVCLVVFLSKNKKNNINENDISNPQVDNDQLLKPTYIFNNTVGDLKRINVQQTSNKNMTINGQITQFLIYRNTTYDIYILSEEPPNEENKNFYTNKYTASINIVKECYSYKNENCESQNYIDFSNNENKNNLRKLQQITDLKDIPLPLCIFNFTDNDIITSFKCPESLPESKKYEILLDLHFFRPLAIEKSKMDPLKNTTFEKKSISTGTFTREKNFGFCNAKNDLKTYCTTDMNTTTDLYNNLLTYDEIAFTNFFRNE